MISNGMENDFLEGQITADIEASGEGYKAVLRYKTTSVKEIPP